MHRLNFFKKKTKLNAKAAEDPNAQLKVEKTAEKNTQQFSAECRAKIKEIYEGLAIHEYPLSLAIEMIRVIDDTYNLLLREQWKSLEKLYKSGQTDVVDILKVYNEIFNYGANVEEALSRLPAEIVNTECQLLITDTRHYIQFLADKKAYEDLVKKCMNSLYKIINARFNSQGQPGMHGENMGEILPKCDINSLRLLKNFCDIESQIARNIEYCKHDHDGRNFYKDELKAINAIHFKPTPIETVILEPQLTEALDPQLALVRH